MKSTRYFPIAITFGFAGACIGAQIGAPAVAPASTQPGVAAVVTVTSLILDPTVIPSSINLQQLDAQGRIVKVVGAMSDNGVNGDAQAGDRIFTIRFPVLEQNPAAQTYRVSAGVLGSLTRAFSSPVNFNIIGTGTGIAIAQPSNLTFTNISPIVIAGTTGDPGATVQVNGIPATRAGNSFQASVPLQEGTNPITAVAANTNGTASTTSIQLTLDTTPPHVTVDSPAAGFITAEATLAVSGIVNDLVVGTVNDQQATVTVNGTAARVANRRYVLENVPLAVGNNTIQVVSRDRTGNSATTSVTVTRQAPGPQSIKLISGNNQTGTVGMPLGAPFVVQLLNGGAPAPNVPVIFKITQNDGVLLPGNGKQQLITVNTDTQGQAKATLTVGHRSGAGNNTIQAFAPGFDGVALFTASGTAQAAARINVDTGGGQFGPIGQALALPFVAVVSDASGNRLDGVSVTFTVKGGGGNIGGKSAVQTTTDGDGRALAVLTLGLEPGQDNELVEATFADNPGSPATFRASAKVPGDPAKTSISGVVVDNSNNPIAGVTMRLFRANQGVNNNQPVQIGTPVPTDAKGFFRIAPAPVGLFKLMADGITAAQPGRDFPTLEYEIVTIAGQDNGVGMPIYLPVIDPGAKLCVNATEGGELKPPNSPGFSLKIQAGAATFPGGGKTGCVSVSPVNPDKVPMTPAFGQQPRFVVTIQPVGTIFNPPAAVSIPNLEGLVPNSKTEMFSFDHDLSTFVSIGSATVSADGSVIASDPGVGVLKAGWFDGAPPPDAIWSLDPVTVTLAAEGPLCGVAPDDTFAAATIRTAAPEPGATCPPKPELFDITQGPVLMKRSDKRLFHAAGSVAGTYEWTTTDPAILRIAPQQDPTFLDVTALKPGKAIVQIQFTATSPDGKRHIVIKQIGVNVWAVEKLEITPSGNQTILKPPPALSPGAEISVPLEVSLTLTSPGADEDQTTVQQLRLSFEDPDDTSASAVIDPLGSAGNDNASIEAGGKRGNSVMWQAEPFPAVVVLEGGQTAGVRASECKLNGVCKAQVTFLSSAIAGDNYIFKAEELDFDQNTNTIVRATARSGTWSVRKFVEMNGFQGAVFAPFISDVMKTSEIAPAFSGDAYTDYTLAGLATLSNAPSPLFDIVEPNASEKPTEREKDDFGSTDPAVHQAAESAIRNKAAKWYLRNRDLRQKAEAEFAGRFGAGQGPTVFSVPAFDDKEDGLGGFGITNFYPAGISISVPTGLGGAVLASFDPNGKWPCLQVDALPEIGAIFMQPFCPDVSADHLRNLLRQAVALVSDHEPFDATDTGLLAPDAPSGVLDDKNVLRMRGYKQLP